MLIRFSVENYLSFSAPVELSMSAGNVRRLPNHVIPKSRDTDIPALKLALIYGANASGKSNLIRAMHDARKFILSGRRPEGGFKSNMFKLDPSIKDAPATFEFTVKSGEKYYEYGFSYAKNRVLAEWLKEVNRKTSKTIYERAYNSDTEAYDFSYSKINFKTDEDEQFFSFTEKGTPDNRLFISECESRGIRKNIPYLDSILECLSWFRDKLLIIFPQSRFNGLEYAIQESTIAADIFTEILKKFDIGITGLKLRSINVDAFLEKMPKDIKSRFLNDLRKTDGNTMTISNGRDERYLVSTDKDGEIVAHKVSSVHEDNNGDPVDFDIADESDGTRRLLDIIPGILGLLVSDRVVVIDELDNNMHPAITRSIVSSFLSETAGKESQLLITTHDASLLDQDVIRKDEVWFVEKNSVGASSIHSLEEFKEIRFDRDLNKGYLEGRFGGVPITSQLERISIPVSDD